MYTIFLNMFDKLMNSEIGYLFLISLNNMGKNNKLSYLNSQLNCCITDLKSCSLKGTLNAYNCRAGMTENEPRCSSFQGLSYDLIDYIKSLALQPFYH